MTTIINIFVSVSRTGYSEGGILQNNVGSSYLVDTIEKNGFQPTAHTTRYVVEQDRNRIEAEENYKYNGSTPAYFLN